MTVNTNVTAGRIAELGGATNSGLKLGFVDSGAKASADDTWTVKNAKTILAAYIKDDSDGTAEEVIISSGNILTLGSSATGAGSGIIIFK